MSTISATLENTSIERGDDRIHLHLDLLTPEAGVYDFGGMTNSLSQQGGGEIVINQGTDGFVRIGGDILAGQAQRPNLPPETATFTLENPMGAEIHAAIAPHGQFDAATIGEEIYNPTGDPGCGCWWVAVFGSPDQPQDMATN